MQTPALRKEEEASGRGEATVEESGERSALGGRGGMGRVGWGGDADRVSAVRGGDWVFGCLGPTFARETLLGVGAVR